MSAVLVDNGIDKGAIWHFGEVSKEQRALADGKAWADLSHRAVIEVAGEDRLSWLHSLSTQHLEKLQPGTWIDALILDPQGHIEQQFILVDDGKASYLVLDSQLAPALINYLEKMRFMLRVSVRDASDDYAILKAPGKSDALGGPYALVPRAEVENMKSLFGSNAIQVGIWALEAERIATGRPRIGLDMDHKSIPNELGLLNKSVHMNKGCYRGQETVAKIFNLGRPPRRLALLHLDGSNVELPSTGDVVMNGETEVGFIGSVGRHYELGPIALALIKRSTPTDATLIAAGVSASQEVIS